MYKNDQFNSQIYRYRIAIAYTITSTTVNQFRLYLNGKFECSLSNTTLNTTGIGTVYFGTAAGVGANNIHYFDDIYVDSGTDLTDPGDIRVTNKRPYANGTANQFTTQIGTGGSGYGSGHAPQVNEQPKSTANGWSLSTTTKKTEEYNIESASIGGANLTGTTLLGYEGWIVAQNSKSTNSPVSNIIVNGVATAVTMTQSPALYTKITNSSPYPAGTGTDIGMDGQYTSSAGTWSLYEAGMLFAYIPTPSLSNFPVLISMTDANLADKNNGGYVQNSSGYDIVFTDSTGTTKLDHEIEKYDGTTGTLAIWVRIPTLSASADTVLYMYFDNSSISTSQENKTGVWNSNYASVWHLRETGGTTNSNSTSTSGIDATKASSTQPTPTTGKIGGGQQFNNPGTFGVSATDYALVNDNAALDFAGSQDLTVSAWVKTTQGTQATYWPAIVSKENRADTRQGYDLSLHQSTTDARWYFEIFVNGTNYDAYGTSDIADGNWHYIVGKRVGSTIYANQDGVAANSLSASSGSVSKAIPLGFGKPSSNAGTEGCFVGALDEIHISNVARTDGWITTEYNNQNSPSTFSSFSDLETNIIDAIWITQTWTQGAATTTNYRVYGPLTSIKNGDYTLVADTDYKWDGTSSVITFKAAYLNTLSEGSTTITVSFSGGVPGESGRVFFPFVIN